MSALAAAMLIPAAAQMGMSIWQLAQARKYGKAKQPEMPIPTAALEALNSARTQANQVENPFAAMQRQQLGQNVSQGMDALSMGSTSGTDILGGVNQLATQNQQGILGIGQQNIAYEQESEHNLTNMLQNMANLQNQQWQTNVYQPWQQNMATSSAMLGASQQNALGALQSGMQGYMAGEYLNNVRNPVVGGRDGDTGGGANMGGINYAQNNAPGTTVPTQQQSMNYVNPFEVETIYHDVINPDAIIDTRGLRTPIQQQPILLPFAPWQNQMLRPL